MKERAGMRRYLFEEIVATSKDLRRIRVGTTDRGGRVALDAVFDCTCACACACKVEVKRNVVVAFTLLGILHRVRAVRGFPGSMGPITSNDTSKNDCAFGKSGGLSQLLYSSSSLRSYRARKYIGQPPDVSNPLINDRLHVAGSIVIAASCSLPKSAKKPGRPMSRCVPIGAPWLSLVCCLNGREAGGGVLHAEYQRSAYRCRACRPNGCLN